MKRLIFFIKRLSKPTKTLPLPRFRRKDVFDLWCNGNTTDFGSVFQGSSPCRSTRGKNVGFELRLTVGVRILRQLDFTKNAH